MSNRAPIPILLAILLAIPPARAASVAEPASVVIRPGAGEDPPDPGLDMCLLDQSTDSRLRFDSVTGRYVACGSDGTFEQGVGELSVDGHVLTLSHTFDCDSTPFITIRASVDLVARTGTADLMASDENRPLFKRFSITDSNIDNNGDCSACPFLNSPTEGIVNYTGIASSAIGGKATSNYAQLLQRFQLNDDFSGRLTRVTLGVARNDTGLGDLTFKVGVYRDNNGQPGTQLYLSPSITLSNIAPIPALYLVPVMVDLPAMSKYWIGPLWNPTTDRLYVPFDTNLLSPKTNVFFCDSPGNCDNVTGFSSFSDVRNAYISLDWKYPGVYESGGFVRYGNALSDYIASTKSRNGYSQLDLKPTGLSYLNTQGGATSFPATDYANAFARITQIAATSGTGLDGIAESRYGMMRFEGFSYATPSSLNFCTRLEGVTDFACRTVPGFTPGTGGFTRVAGVSNGFEYSYGNAVADRIDRWLWQYDAVSGWKSQALNPVTSSPSIGNPEFGFPWYKELSWKLGVAYEYKTTSGNIEAKWFNGNQLLGTLAVDTDTPPPGFNPAEASRMAGDCTRDGLCIFGRYDSGIGMNVADYIDFRVATPEISHIVLGAGPKGLDFGRAVSIHDDNALYASYLNSPTSGQYRLSVDYIGVEDQSRQTLGFDEVVGGGTFPLALSRADGDWGLGHFRGVDILGSLTAGCDLSRVRARSGPGSTPTSTPGIGLPCENLAATGGRK